MPFQIATEPLKSQDRALADRREGYTLLMIADGAGGTGSGDTAAEELVVQMSSRKPTISQASDPLYWTSALHDLDGDLTRQVHGGETTAVISVAFDGLVCGASVGDSCAWLIHDGTYENLTSAQVRKPLLGSGAARATPFGPAEIKGTLLIATDGLVNYTAHEKLVALVESQGIRCAPTLIDLARLPSGELHDDTTVVLYSA